METRELQSLIKKITAEVVGSMLTQHEVQAAVKDLPLSVDKPLLVLIPELVEEPKRFIDHLLMRHPGNKLVLGVHGKADIQGLQQVREVFDIDDIPSRQKLSAMVNEFDAIYLVCPEIMQIKAIAEGDDRGLAEKLVTYFVLHGKNTGIILDYDISKLSSNNITKKLRELYSSIKDMGISVEVLNSTQEEPVKAASGKGKDLITEKDVEDMFKNGVTTINVGSGSIITPLAKDKAKELKMSLA